MRDISRNSNEHIFFYDFQYRGLCILQRFVLMCLSLQTCGAWFLLSMFSSCFARDALYEPCLAEVSCMDVLVSGGSQCHLDFFKVADNDNRSF